MQASILTPEFIGWLINATLQMATPLVLAGLGGMFSERSGVVNIGLEGMMLMGAFTGVAATHYTKNPWIGLLAAVISGALLGLVHAVICVKLKGNQIVSGAGIILFAGGFTTLMLQVIWQKKGFSDEVAQLPQVALPWLANVPVLNTAISSLSPIIYIMFAMVPVSWYVMYRTPFGLRLRSAGEDPSALDTAGVSVDRMRVYGVVLSGILAAVGGAHLSIGYGRWFGKLMTSGRGFVALAALIFGNWNPLGVFIAGMFFGLLSGSKTAIEIAGVPGLAASTQFLQMIPYICVVIALGVIRRSVPPKSIGVPYFKEQRA